MHRYRRTKAVFRIAQQTLTEAIIHISEQTASSCSDIQMLENRPIQK